MQSYNCCCCSVAQSCPTLCDPMDWPHAHQASLSPTISQSLAKFMSIASFMPSSHLILWCPLLLLPSVFPRIRDFSNESAVCIRLPKSWRFSFSSVFPLCIQGSFPLRLTSLISLLPKGLSGVFSSTTVWRHHFFGILPSVWSTIHDYWEDRRLDYTDLCWESNVSAFQHTVSVCHSFPAKKQSSSDFMAAVTIYSDLRAQEEEICHYFHIFPFYLPWSNGQDAMILVFFFFNI